MMGLLTLSCLLLAVGYSAAKYTRVSNCGRSRPSGRIVNGVTTTHGDHPWMVAIFQKRNDGSWKFICGGSVLNENWIITAAHCIDEPVDTKDYELFVGLRSIKNKTEATVQKLQLSEVIRHEKYRDETDGYDVALLKTANKIDIAGSKGYVNAICLPKANSSQTGEATVIGWGKLSDNGALSEFLLKATVPIVAKGPCANKYEDENSDFVFIPVEDHMLCAGGNGKDSCQYDSGGPLFQTNPKTGVATLIGIVSGGADCAYKDYPGLYMKVSAFRDWIDTHI